MFTLQDIKTLLPQIYHSHPLPYHVQCVKHYFRKYVIHTLCHTMFSATVDVTARGVRLALPYHSLVHGA